MKKEEIELPLEAWIQERSLDGSLKLGVKSRSKERFSKSTVQIASKRGADENRSPQTADQNTAGKKTPE